MVSGGAPAYRKATLLQGLPLRAERIAAGQFWTFTMSNSKQPSRELLVAIAWCRFTLQARGRKFLSRACANMRASGSVRSHAHARSGWRCAGARQASICVGTQRDAVIADTRIADMPRDRSRADAHDERAYMRARVISFRVVVV